MDDTAKETSIYEQQPAQQTSHLALDSRGFADGLIARSGNPNGDTVLKFKHAPDEESQETHVYFHFLAVLPV